MTHGAGHGHHAGNHTTPPHLTGVGARDRATGAGTSLLGLSALLPFAVSPPCCIPVQVSGHRAHSAGWQGSGWGGKGPILPQTESYSTWAVVGRQIENRLAFPAHPAPLILFGDKAYPKDGLERVGCLSPPHLPRYLSLAAAEGQSTLLPLSTMEGPQPAPGSGATRHPRCPWLNPALLGHPQPPARGVLHGRGCAHPVCAMHSVPPAQLQVLSVRAHVRGVCTRPHARVP